MYAKIRSTPVFLAALACMIFGFAPLLMLLIAAGLEMTWLFLSELPSTGIIDHLAATANAVVRDWASLYLSNGRYNVGLFAIQCMCALLWCAYLKWVLLRHDR